MLNNLKFSKIFMLYMNYIKLNININNIIKKNLNNCCILIYIAFVFIYNFQYNYN